MQRIVSFWICLSFSFPISAKSLESGILFRWKWNTGQILELNEYHDVLIRAGAIQVAREDRNRILLKAKICDVSHCKVDGTFDTYVRYGKTVGPYQKDKEFKSQFTIFRNGAYSVPEQFIMPNLRGFPTFPDRELSNGEHWKLTAEESFDFGGPRILVTVDPTYTLLGESDWKYEGYSGRSQKIAFSYSLNFDAISSLGKQKEMLTLYKGNPIRIEGQAKGIIYFNSDKGVPEFKETQIKYKFVFPNGQSQEAQFSISGVYHFREGLDQKQKEKVQDQIIQDLIVEGESTKQEIEKANKFTVNQTEEGISFSLNSVLFDSNEAKLKPEAIETLNRISGILKKFPDREIRVSGHTDSVGKKDYNFRLSEDRARSVLQNLVDEQGIGEDRISFKGYGDQKPIDTNETESGKAKNRRVDILLVLD